MFLTSQWGSPCVEGAPAPLVGEGNKFTYLSGWSTWDKAYCIYVCPKDSYFACRKGFELVDANTDKRFANELYTMEGNILESKSKGRSMKCKLIQ